MKYVLTFLMFTPFFLSAQVAVAPSVTIGDLDDHKILSPGVEIRYEEGTNNLLSRFYTGVNTYHNGEENYLGFRYNIGWMIGAGYNRNFMAVVGIENQYSNREESIPTGENKSETTNFWFAETQFLVGFQLRGNDKKGNHLEILPFYSKGENSKSLGVRLSYSFELKK